MEGKSHGIEVRWQRDVWNRASRRRKLMTIRVALERRAYSGREAQFGEKLLEL